MTYLEAIEDALARFPDMPAEMRQAFYTVLLVGDVTEEEAAYNRGLYSKYTLSCAEPALLLPTVPLTPQWSSSYKTWVNTYISLISDE